MPMLENYRNATATYGGSLITHIGLVNQSENEISGGGYARQAVTWTTASGGIIRPSTDLTFDIPAGTTVAGWRGFSASSGGTNYGGHSLTEEYFANAGQYKLVASSTGIKHVNPA